MKKEAIVFYDSGMGGLSIYQTVYHQVPHLRLVYVADNKHFPYGRKEPEQIVQFASSIVRRLEDIYQINTFVVACNTASVVVLPHLRAQFTFPIVGTVPAVKVAGEQTQNKRFGVIATELTAQQDYLRNLIKDHAEDCEVHIKGSAALVELVEKPELYPHRQEILLQELEPLIKADIDYLVLGSTHFFHLYDEINNLVGHKIKVIDSRDGVTKQVLRVVKIDKTLEKSGSEKNNLYLTDATQRADIARYEEYARAHPSLTFRGELNLID